MKIFRIVYVAILATALSVVLGSCVKDEHLKELEMEYSQLITGKWFDFSRTSSMYAVFESDNSFYQIGYGNNGWRERTGTYQIKGDKLIREFEEDGKLTTSKDKIEVTAEKLIFKRDDAAGDRVHYRVKENFSIQGNYSYLNGIAKVEPAEGKTELKLPDGITFQGKNAISIESMNGERIIGQMQEYFNDAMFTPNGKLRHTVDGTVLYEDYTIDDNNLEFDLYSKDHKIKATTFPDEDGDRLFIIIPKQEAWIGGLADILRKENPAANITGEIIAALEKEFMDTFQTFTVVLSLSKTGEYNAAEDVDPYKDYPEFIVGKWFNFTPDASGYISFQADGNYSEIGYNRIFGWAESTGTYRLDGNKLINTMSNSKEYSNIVDVTKDKLTYKAGGNPNYPEQGELNFYRVKESFDIKGNYTYLNSVARVEAAAGKTALQLPDGLLFNGQNSIPVSAMHGERIIEVMKKFFADATFAADGKLNHKMDNEAKVKNYTINGNNLVFNLYEGSDKYKVNATSFPDEDGDRLFIIIPKQAAWLGGMVELVEKENTGVKLTEAQIAELEKEFMATFETFTVVLSLSKK